MQDETVTVDQRKILIRPMNSTHIIGECAHCRAEGWTSPAFSQFHAELMRRYGNAAIVATCEDKIVGFANFYPAVLNSRMKTSLCPAVDADLGKSIEQIEWPVDPGDTLSISCVNLDGDLLRKGIGTRLVRKAVEWARTNGYRKVHAGANDTAWWIPCREFYEKLGFHVLETIEFEKPREDGEMRVYTMELALAD